MHQHLFNKDSIPLSRILYQNMGHRPYQSAILDDGAAAHPLHDPACNGEKIRVCYFKHNSPVDVIIFQVDIYDLNIINFRFPAKRADDLSLSFFNLLL